VTSTRPRDGAYIWVTWIAPLLAGTNSCVWAPWFKAHFYFQKVGEFDQDKWLAEHRPLVEYWRDKLGSDGFTVTEENDNKFTLSSGSIVLAGQPDLVAVGAERAIVVDCKSGMPRPTHRIQVMIYMAALSSARPDLKGRPIEGLIRYPDDYLEIPASDVDSEFRSRLRTTIHAIAGDPVPAREPTFNNCRFCPIGPADCPDRVQVLPPEAVTDHDLF
jgi:hypothetical protein